MYMTRAHQFVLPFKMLGLGLLVFLPLLEAADTGNFTYVTQAVSNAEDTAHCINGGDQFPCFTLAYVANQISSSSTIRIKVSELDINDTVSFINVSNVTIEGSSARTVLRCNCINCGVEFKHSQNITIKFLAFTGCGVRMRTFHIGAALVVYKCCNFFIENSNFSKNTDTGLSLIDTHGYVDIHNTTMYGNGVGECQNCSGLLIHFTKSIASIYSIEDCHLWKNNGGGIRASFGGGISLEFTGNSANNKVSLRNVHLKENGARWGGGIFVEFSNISKHNQVFFDNVTSYKNMWKNETHENSYGGGIGLKFTRYSANNHVSLRDVHLEENAATWGGGILIEFTSRSHCNQVNLDNVTAYDNTAYKAGGGIDIGFIKSTSTPPITNIVFIENSNFIGNYARYGGGTAIYASSTARGMEEAHHSDNTLVFRSCNWEGNGAHYFGSAIDVSPFAYDALGSLYFPHPKFVNCTFRSNNMKKQDFINNDLRPRQYNVGSFAVYGFEVQFEDKVEFYDHTSTALHVTQSIVTFLNNTEALFQNNSGYKGGAMSLSGSSSLWLYPNTTLNFHHNTASDRGGAIYHTTQNYHDFISSRTCFIKSYTNEQQEMPQLIFDGNNATQAGKSMYSTTFLPCYFEQSMGLWNLSRSENHTVADALNKIANFRFVEQNYQEALATSGISLNFKGNKRLDVVPGKTVAIPTNMTDELGSCYPSIFRVVSAKTCETDRFYILDKIGIKGKEKDKCNLTLISVSLRATEFKLTVSVEKCPPGFHADNKSCICSAYSKKHAYHGITTCHDRRPFAYLKQGFWAGFDTDHESLLTATPCPSSFCVAKVNKSAGPGIALPQQSSPKALEHIICQPHRTGWLCGRCQTNRTIHYHSPSYHCGSQGNCVCGILFYLLSEILPIAVMFSVIAIFDIRFTTGTASGLVFFAQVIDTVSLNMKWNLEMSKSIESLSILYKVIYGLFNFSFFNLEGLSFCLWKNATVLDVIAFRYVSVVFAFFLLLLIVLFLKYCTCNCSLLKNDRLRRNRSRSVIHSISALLVTCYAQCTNISFHILAKTTLKGAGGEVKHDVTLFGGVHYFQKDHLMYAVAACFCLSTIVALPPLLLLVYPGYTTIFSFCKLNETRPLRIVSQLFMKLKPFLDSFQGCYKDKLRFFSGFYFVSRVVISAVNAFVSSILETFIFTEIILLLLLGAYAICHPFQKAKDNINNGLILLNMTIIGCLTILAYSQNADDTHIVTTALTIRLILLYLPIVCVCANMVKGAAGSYIKKRKKKIDLNDLRFEDTHNLQVIDHNYLPFQEVAVDSTEQSPEDSDSLYREDILEYM